MRGKRGSGKSVPYSTKAEIKGLIDNGVRGMSIEELKQVEIGLIKYTRQAYTRMVKAGETTPMIEDLALNTSRETKSGKIVEFSRLRGKDANYVNYVNRINDYLRVINSDYFGIKGARKYKEKYESGTGMDYDISSRRLWRIYSRLKERKKIVPMSPPEKWLPIIMDSIIENPGYTDEEIMELLEAEYGAAATPEEADINEV